LGIDFNTFGTQNFLANPMDFYVQSFGQPISQAFNFGGVFGDTDFMAGMLPTNLNLFSNFNFQSSQPRTNHSFKKSQFTSMINASAQKYGVDPALINSIIKQESNFDANAQSKIYSKKTGKYEPGAIGLMQLMPKTAAGLGVKDPWDPAQNIDGGTKYLAQLIKRYHGDVTKAVAAYNGGIGNVEKYGNDFCAETRNYHKKVMSTYNA